MRFDGATLATLLGAIAKAAGLEMRPYRSEGDRTLTIDVSGRTVNEALKAVESQINGEGVVMIRNWDGSMAQYRVVGYQMVSTTRASRMFLSFVTS